MEKKDEISTLNYGALFQLSKTGIVWQVVGYKHGMVAVISTKSKRGSAFEISTLVIPTLTN